ncbi:MAG TPA: hypothetical protein VNJ01_08720 [Bacteriovoracaceae bacterium]|nr:hypothetical protein [Bacteriovoracaceae bacterium]
MMDVIFAIPLLLFPVQILTYFGWEVIDPLTTRLVGAALIGIGVESFLGRNAGMESFQGMLRLKILWSLSANIGIAVSIAEGAPKIAWLFQIVFILFSILWIYYKFQLDKNPKRFAE